MRKFASLAAVAAALILIGAGCAGQGQPSPAGGKPPEGAVGAPPSGPGPGNTANAPGAQRAMAPGIIVVPMHPKGGDDEVGNAILSAVDENHTKVSITLANAPTNVTEDAGIYGGTCTDLGAPLQYDLGSVAKGRGVTTLNVNLSSFVGGTKQSVRVITMPAKPEATFWTCGDIH